MLRNNQVSLLEWWLQVAEGVQVVLMLERQAWILRPARLLGFLYIALVIDLGTRGHARRRVPGNEDLVCRGDDLATIVVTDESVMNIDMRHHTSC